MKRNIQHSRFNIQRPTARHGSPSLGCWALNVECLIFLLLAFIAQSVFSQTTNALPPLSPAYPEIPPTFFELYGTAIFAGSVALVALAAVILWKRLQPEPAIVLPPDIVAREALVQFQRQPEDGKALSEISQILRHYIIAAFKLPAAEMTSAEFSTALAGNEKIGVELAGAIAAFLRECDERKFSAPVRSPALTQPEPPEGGIPNFLPPLNAATRALGIISLAEKARDGRDTCPTMK